MNHRSNISIIYEAGLKAVVGDLAVFNSLPCLLDDNLILNNRPIRFVSIGKAADSMLSAALEVVGDKVESALLITKSGHISNRLKNNPLVQYIEAAHPVPDESSLRAGRQLIDFCSLVKPNHTDIFLISGGTSSLVEVLPENWTLKEYQALTEWMLKNSFSISQINTVRGRISQIKQGQLWKFITAESLMCLMISDVSNNDCSVIGSGLLFAGKANRVSNRLPEHWRNKIPEKVNLPLRKNFIQEIIADNRQALVAAAKKAEALGYSVIIRSDFLQGDSVEVAKYCCDQSRQYRQQLLIWGAETTVTLPDNVGRGGRCQHLALAAALYLQGSDDTTLLAATTDGGDGSSSDSGAIVDGGSIFRMQQKGLNAVEELHHANSGVCLEASNDLITTGLTGTNVMDLVIAFSA